MNVLGVACYKRSGADRSRSQSTTCNPLHLVLDCQSPPAPPPLTDDVHEEDGDVLMRAGEVAYLQRHPLQQQHHQTSSILHLRVPYLCGLAQLNMARKNIAAGSIFV